MIRQLPLAAATLVALFALSGVAHANKIRVLNYKVDDGASVGAIELLAKDPIGEPWMRFEKGGIRIWFPDIEDITRFEKSDGDKPIHSVRLRYGSDNTAVLKVDFSDHRMLRKEDIELMRNGAYALIKIHYAEAPAPAAKVAPVAPQPVAQPAAVASAQPAYKTSGANRLAAFSAGLRTGASANTSTPKQSAVHSTQQKSGFSFAPSQKNVASSMGVLLLISIALGGIYGLIHFGQRKNQLLGAPAPIQVVAVKRVGPRHQLMLIRALGHDHLLSMHAGRIERLGSAPSPVEETPRITAEDTLPGRNTRMGLGLFAPFSLQKKLRSALEEDAPANNPQTQAQFGGELMGFMRNQAVQRASSVGKTPLPPSTTNLAAGSDSVAGIARLRNRALS